MIIWEDITESWNNELNDDCQYPKVEEFETEDFYIQIFHNDDEMFTTGGNYTTRKVFEISSKDGNIKALAEEWINEQMQ